MAAEAPGYSLIPGVDPYVDWALGAGRPHFFLAGRQQEWMPILVRLRGIRVEDFKTGNFFRDDEATEREEWPDAVHVAPPWIDAPAGADGATYCTAMVRQRFFEFLKRSEALRKVVSSVTLGLPLDSESLPAAQKKSAVTGSST
jgi:hypothetical protein